MIFIECKPDEALLKSLGVTKKRIDHRGNKPEVCKALEKNNNSKGLIDEYPWSVQPSYMDRLYITQNLKEDMGIVVFSDEKENIVIMLCPRLEEWILSVAKECKVDIRKYGLPDDPEKLHGVVNLNLKKFHVLLDDLKSKSKTLNSLREIIMVK